MTGGNGGTSKVVNSGSAKATHKSEMPRRRKMPSCLTGLILINVISVNVLEVGSRSIEKDGNFSTTEVHLKNGKPHFPSVDSEDLTSLLRTADVLRSLRTSGKPYQSMSGTEAHAGSRTPQTENKREDKTSKNIRDKVGAPVPENTAAGKIKRTAVLQEHPTRSDNWESKADGNMNSSIHGSLNTTFITMIQKSSTLFDKAVDTDILFKEDGSSLKTDSPRPHQDFDEGRSGLKHLRNGSLEGGLNETNDSSIADRWNFNISSGRDLTRSLEDRVLRSSSNGTYAKNPNAVNFSQDRRHRVSSTENQKYLRHSAKDAIQLKDPAAYVGDFQYDSPKVRKVVNREPPEATRRFLNLGQQLDFRDVFPKVIKKQFVNFVGDGDAKETGEGPHPTMPVVQQWEHLEESFRESVEAVVRQALPLLVRASSEIQLSVGCYTSFFQLLLGLRRLRPWAFQMIDAFGKPPAGMLQGTVTSFGAYDECVNIVATSEPREMKGSQHYFRGKYCTVEIKPPLPPKPQHYTMYEPVSVLANFSNSDDNVIRQAARQAHAFYFLTYRVDVCVPSTCTQDDVNNMAQFAAQYVEIEVTVPRCNVKEILPMDKTQIAVLCILAILTALVLLGTAMDALKEIFRFSVLLRKYLTKTTIKVLSCFSLNNNADMLFNRPSQDGLNALHGIRFFAMAWLVLGHTYFSSNVQMYGNLTEASAFARGFLFQVIVNSTISLDTFFFISGVLLSYFTLQHDGEKNGVYNIPRLFFRRYIRIVPSYLMVIGATFLLPHLGSGPFWSETVDPVVETCKKRWWTNLLFINNLAITPEERCLEHSWYLSCDFQLFVIAVFLLLAFIRRPALGIAINVVLIVVSVSLTGLLTYYYNVPPTLLASFPDPEERKYLNHVIISKPFCHLGPYCVGLITGYFFSTCRKIRMKIYHHLIGWGISLSVTAAVVYGVLEWNKGNMPSKPVALIYAATHRTAWALGLAWMTAVCIAGHGGIINRILSWGVFIPLSRLTHIVYLVHPLIQYILTGYIRERLQTNHIILAYFFFGHIMTSYALSFACFFLFDGPASALVQVLFGESSLSASKKSASSSDEKNRKKAGEKNSSDSKK